MALDIFANAVRQNLGFLGHTSLGKTNYMRVEL